MTRSFYFRITSFIQYWSVVDVMFSHNSVVPRGVPRSFRNSVLRREYDRHACFETRLVPISDSAKLSNDFKPSCVALPDRHQVHRLQVSVGTRCIRYVRDGVWLQHWPFFRSNLLNLISAPETVFDIEIQDLMVCASHFWFQIFYACSKLMKVTQGWILSIQTLVCAKLLQLHWLSIVCLGPLSTCSRRLLE